VTSPITANFLLSLLRESLGERDTAPSQKDAKGWATISFVYIDESVAAAEPSRVSPKTIDSSGPQPAPANTGVVRKRPRSSFKTALQLARPFPFGSSPLKHAHIAITPI
jgi:hypothetical protein